MNVKTSCGLKKKKKVGWDSFVESRVTKAAILAQAALRDREQDPGTAFGEAMTRIPLQASSPGCYWKGHTG